MTRTKFEIGDHREVAELYVKYYEKLREKAAQSLANARPAVGSEDIAQSAFLSLCRWIGNNESKAEQLAQQAEEESRDGILFIALAIARNKAIDANRRAGKGKPKFSNFESIDIKTKTNDAPDVVALVNEQFELIGRYLSGNEELQQIVSLRIEGVSSKEIAVQLGKSEPTISRRLKEVRRMLKENYLETKVD